jgi:RNA polymerase sigma-70 factor (ECF subfamily)
VSELLEYVGHVFRFALRLSRNHHAAEDICQETLLRAWKHRHRLRDDRAIRTWLFKIAANLWRDRLRRSQHRVAQAGPVDEDLVGRVVAPEDAIALREDARWAVAAIDSLPARQREVLYLHACEGLTHEEIGNVLGVSPENVKASLSLARRRMRQRWKERRDNHVSK